MDNFIVSTEWEKIFTGHRPDKSLVPRIYKEAWELNNKMIGNPIKEWEKNLNRNSSKEDVQIAHKILLNTIGHQEIDIKWKQLKHISNGEWISNMWFLHTMEYYYAIKRTRVLIHTTNTTWMNLDNIMLRERRQRQKSTYWIIPFIWNV